MELELGSFIIVCPLLFLAGLVDSIAGGGGLISLPAYVLAGLPMHMAIGTNKLSSSLGTCLAAFRFIKNGLVVPTLVLPGIAAAMIGSSIGSRLSLLASEELIRSILFVVLPIAAIIVLDRHLFPQGGSPARADKRSLLVCIIASLVIGMYDGFYGPGTGTFLIIAFTVFAHFSVSAANAQAKLINLSSNLTSVFVFLVSGTVLLPLGLAGAACNMLGNYIGSGLAMKNGANITRPLIILVLALLFLKLMYSPQ